MHTSSLEELSTEVGAGEDGRWKLLGVLDGVASVGNSARGAPGAEAVGVAGISGFVLLAVGLDISERHDWEGDLGDGGCIDSHSVVITGIVLVSDTVGDGLDLFEVSNDVLVGSLVDLHLTLALPVVEPSLDHIFISLDAGRASIHEGVDFWEVSEDFLETLEDLAVVLSSEVGNKFADVGLEFWAVSEASLHGLLIVVSSESSHETSEVVSNYGGAQGEVGALGVSELSSSNRKGDLGHGGGNDSDTVVVTSVILVWHFVGKLFDLVEVSNKVLVSSLVDLHFSLASPVGVPVLKYLFVGLYLGWAGGHEGVELWKISEDCLKSFHNLAVVLGSEIGDKIADIVLEALIVNEASLHSGLVVVTSESRHEASKVVSDDGGVYREVTTVGVSKTVEHLGGWDWKGKLGKLSSLLGSAIPVLGIVVITKKLDVSQNSVDVAGEVFVGSGVKLERSLALPVCCPALNDCKISLGIWASIKETCKGWDLGHEDLDTLDDLAVILGSDIGDGSADGLLERVSVLEAALQVGLVVMSGESVDESSNEVSDLNCV